MGWGYKMALNRETKELIDEEWSIEEVEQTNYSDEDEEVESGAKTTTDALFMEAYERSSDFDFELI